MKTLTSVEIIDHITNETMPNDWPWESALDSAIGNHEEGEAADAARFLEKLTPGKEWTAEEYHGLMVNHFTGRWDSAAEIGRIRAGESYEDAKERYKDNPTALAHVERRFAERTASDEAAEKYIRNLQSQGTHVFDCPDGSVLTFDKLFGGVIDLEEPV